MTLSLETTVSLDDAFWRLPDSLLRSTIHSAHFTVNWKSLRDRLPLHASLSIRPTRSCYSVDFTLSPSLALESDLRARQRGAIEYSDFPFLISMISMEVLEHLLTPSKYHLVPHVDQGYDQPSGSPFVPSGRWQKLPTDPIDPTLRAHLDVPRSIAPYSFAEILNKIAYGKFSVARFEYAR